MKKKFIFGDPFPTEAVINDIPAADELIPYFEVPADGVFEYKLEDDDIVYGLGEQVRGINKRGWIYVSCNHDNPHHHEDTRSLYGSHNFLIIRGRDLFGVFFDNPGRVTFDIGYSCRNSMRITADSHDMSVYIITGINEKDIVRQFRQMIGKSYIPPFWAFGYGQSRWGYKNENDIRTVAAKYKAAGIPLDSIYLDIDYMDQYKDFTVDKERFPDLEKLVSDMRSEGIHLVPIIDAGVKIEDGYDVYEEGKRKGYFCKKHDGSDFVGAVWPGKVHFPDFMDPEAREWFGSKYSVLTELGIDGFWNDMNEPAIFYTEDSLEETVREADSLIEGNAGINEYFAFTGMVEGLSSNPRDYNKFYHKTSGGMKIHRDIHNLYGMNMTRAASEALGKIIPDRRTLFFSRSSYIGAHRYGGIWQGDNNSWWSHILLALQQLPGLNMAGFLFTGPDTGGFGCDTTEDLMMRWLQLTVFTPLFRNHSSNGTRYQELYRFSNVSSMAEMIKIRYCLIPYLYSEFLKSALNDTMMFRPLAFDFEDDRDASDTEDQLLLGDEIMIAPVYRQNASGRYVYLPEEMMLVRMRSYNDFDTEMKEKGHHHIKAELNELVFFIRKGKSIPFGEPAECTEKTDYSGLKLMGCSGSSYMLYTDDGITPPYRETLRIVNMSME